MYMYMYRCMSVLEYLHVQRERERGRGREREREREGGREGVRERESYICTSCLTRSFLAQGLILCQRQYHPEMWSP